MPADEALPLAELDTAFRRVLADRTESIRALRYSAAHGIEPLRRWLADREGGAAGRVMVTNGSLHGLSLVFDALLDPGDVVAVESPTFPLTLRMLADRGARVLPVPVSAAGLDLDVLETRLRHGLRIKILYLIPDFQNPTGTVLPAADRDRAIRFGEQYGFLVVSDNPYRELRFAGTAVDDLDLGSDVVVRVNTFAKTLVPGLRLGWLTAPDWLVSVLARRRAVTDQFTALLTQTAVHLLLRTPGTFDGLLDRARGLYRERAAALVTGLRDSLPGRVDFDEPHGGIFLWVRATDPGSDLAALRPRARALGTDFTPGQFFDPDGAGHYTGHFRLGYSNTAPQELLTAVQRLSAAFRTDVVPGRRDCCMGW